MPYYEDDAVTIYHGDCREILPELTFDVIVTDPPYGVNFVIAPVVVGKGNRRVLMGGKPPVYGDDKPFDPAPLLATGKPLAIFGGNYFHDALPRSGGWLVWDKTGGGRGPDNSFTDLEIAWTNVRKNPVIFHHLWKGLVRDSEAGETVKHPTQKPVCLMRWVLGLMPAGVVLDPYAGSGPTLRAAKDLGRRAIGIEIEERYCEIAAKRMAQEVLPL
jgi:site-specific DNA-methyltransferase (adenine-specific)